MLDEWEGGHWYYIIFQKRGRPKDRWWHYFLHKDYAHCFLIAKVSNNQTMIVDPLHWGVYINVFDCPIESMIELYRQDSTAIVPYQVVVNKGESWRPRGCYSCVSIVKSILNIRNMSVTPRGFFKRLVRAGVEQI